MVSPISIGFIRTAIYAVAIMTVMNLFWGLSSFFVLRAAWRSQDYVPKTYVGGVGRTSIEVNANHNGVFSPPLEVLHVPMYEINIEEEGEEYGLEEDLLATIEEGAEEEFEEEEEEYEEVVVYWLISHPWEALVGSTRSKILSSSMAAVVGVNAIVISLILLASFVRMVLLLVLFPMRTKLATRHSNNKKLKRKLSIPLGAVVWVGEVCCRID